jgi:hypothetical protein
MHGALLARSLENLEAIRKHVIFSSSLREVVAHPNYGCQGNPVCAVPSGAFSISPDPTSWRIIDHCAAVTRSYAVFEMFVSELLREYLVFLAKSYKMSALGADFKRKFTRGVGQMLLDHDKPKYRVDDLQALLSNASDAISDKLGYQIAPEALLRLEQNLRMYELERLFAQCGLMGLKHWINRHQSVEHFFASESRLSDTAESELREIVEYRNTAAHREVADVLAPKLLVEIVDFFKVLCKTTTDLVTYDTLKRAKDLGAIDVVGSVIHTYRDNVIIVKVRNQDLNVGESLYAFEKGAVLITEIRGIQLEGTPHNYLRIDGEKEIGLQIGVKVRVGCELLRFK